MCPGAYADLASQTDYGFGWSATRQGDTVLQYDYSRDRPCPAADKPDIPVRAFRFLNSASQYRVQMNIAGHVKTRRMVGPSLESAVKETSAAAVAPEHWDCEASVFNAAQNFTEPEQYAGYEWLSSPYYRPSAGVVGLVHNEYHGAQDSTPTAQCDLTPEDPFDAAANARCWMGSITMVVANCAFQGPPDNPNGLGGCYSHPSSSPGHLVAAIPYQYTPNWGHRGYQAFSNILRGEGALNGQYFVMASVTAQQPSSQADGMCILRASEIGSQMSWRAWGGSAFDKITYISPYEPSPPPPVQRVCAPLPTVLSVAPWSLTYNRYLKRYMLLGQRSQSLPGSPPAGVYYSISEDLLNWSYPQLLFAAPPRNDSTIPCPLDPVAYPVLLDPSDPAAAATASTENWNFDHPGRRPDVYFSHEHRSGGCQVDTEHDDLGRIPVEFTFRQATFESGTSLVDLERGFNTTAVSTLGATIGPESGDDYDQDSTNWSAHAATTTGGAGQNRWAYGRIGGPNKPIRWKNGDDAWYGAAFKLNADFLPSAGTIQLMRWNAPASTPDFSGVAYRPASDSFELVRRDPTTGSLSSISPTFSLPTGRWFWLEVHQKLGESSADQPVNEVFLDGALVATSANANKAPGGTSVESVSYGLVNNTSAGSNATLYVDRASVMPGQYGAKIGSDAAAFEVPRTPAGLRSYPSNTTTIVLQWNPPNTSQGDPPVDFYRLYERLANGTWQQVVEDLPANGNVIYLGVLPCTTHVYRVTARKNFAGSAHGESIPSAPVTVTPAGC